ncbi:MAG: hypothetical protein ACRELA_12660 [Candidatus Rokuibacteriota bacterium]
MGELEPIEGHVRDEEPPDDTVLVIRGGPLAPEKLIAHAHRQQLKFSYQGRSMASVSVDATVAGWSLEAILEERLWSRSTYAACEVGRIREAGYVLLATHEAPHYDILLAEASLAAAEALLAVFGAPYHNPYKGRRR